MALEVVQAGTGAIPQINGNLNAVAAARVFGRRDDGSAGLTWGYHGGNAFGLEIPDGDVTLTASSTNYVVASKTTGAVSSSTSDTNWNNVTDYFRISEIETGADSVASEADARDFTGVSASGGSSTRRVNVALSDMGTSLTIGTGKAFWVAPEDGVLTDFWLALGGSQSSSGIVRVDLNKAGSTVLSTRPAIDASESTSLTGTAAVISSPSFSRGDLFTFDIDDAGTGAKGLQAVLEYTP